MSLFVRRFVILAIAAYVTQLYAFHYTPNPPLALNNGWTMYNPRDEFGRMGVGSRTKSWRFTDINKDYAVRQNLVYRGATLYRTPYL